MEAMKRTPVHVRYQRGTMVFWEDHMMPYWVLEWQPDNDCYWIINGNGCRTTATEDELALLPRFSYMPAREK